MTNPQQTEGLTAEILPCPFCGKEAGKCKLACCGNGSSGDGCCGNPVEQFCPLESLEVLHAHSLKTAATESFYQSHNQEMDEHLRIVCAAYMAAMRAASISRPSPPAQEADANEHTMSGSLVFKGTRILVSSVASYINRGSSNDEILEAYPDLTNDQVEAVRAFLERVLPSQSSLIKVLTEALSFYASESRYMGANQRVLPDDKWTDPDAVYRLDVTRDNGDIARKALALVKEAK